QKRIDGQVERVPQSGAVNFQFGAVGTHAHDAAAALHDRPAVLTPGLLDAVVADADIEPAVDSQPHAIGGMVAAAIGDLVSGEPGDRHLLPVGRAVAVLIAEDAERRRMDDPDRAVAIAHAARVFDFGEDRHVIDLAVAVPVDAAEDFSTA